MSFIDWRFSEKFSHEFKGGPDWFTKENLLANGITRRDAGWDYPHHRYTANYTMLSEDARRELRQAMYVTRGRLYSFRFLDPDDHDTEGEQIIGVGDGTTTPKQLVKVYTFGPVSYTRPIRLPFDAVVLADGEEVGVTVDPLTGLATPASAWAEGAVLSWTGGFDVPVLFAADFNPVSMNGPNLRESSVDLVEDMAKLVPVT